MSLPQVQIALEQALFAMTGGLGAALTATENSVFDAKTADEYQRINFLPAAPANPCLGSGMYREEGIMQVSLMYPNGTGKGPANVMAELIRSWFKRGNSFSYGGVVVQIGSTPTIGKGSGTQDRWMLPVSIQYFANIVGS